MAALPAADLLAAPPGEGSAAIRARCVQARERALARQGVPNQQLAGQALDEHLHLQPAAAALVQKTAEHLGWSARATHRALKVARTIADLAQSPEVGVAHVAEAVQYRRLLASP